MDDNTKTSESSDGRGQSITITELRDRARRLYMLGESGLAAELYLESDAKSRRTEPGALWMTV